MGANLTGRIVFSSGKSGDYDIWMLDLDTGQLRQLTSGTHWNDKPRWSPDGKSVIFVSNAAGTPNIYKLDVASLEITPLIENGKWNDFPSYSPDGRQILYISNEAGDNDVWIADANGDNRRQVTAHPGNDNFASWMPDSRGILWSSDCAGDADIWFQNLETEERRRLNDGAGMDIQPVPSPDGKLVAFVSDRQNRPEKKGGPWQDRDLDIYMMRIDGTDVVRLTTNQGSDSCVNFSPDGRCLIYASARAGSSGERLRIMDISEVVAAYERGTIHDIESAVRHASSSKVRMDRAPLEQEIGADINKLSFLAQIMPDSILKLLHGTMHFGWERYPHWVASPVEAGTAAPDLAAAPARR
jgi:Tol biopolymer transport system component